MSCFLLCFGRNCVLETLPGRQPLALTSDLNRKSGPPFGWQSQAPRPWLWSQGRAPVHGLGLWLASLPLVRWKKQSQSDPAEFELGTTFRSRGSIKVRDKAQPELAPMGFVGARCQKWVNIKLYLMKNRRKQSSPYLLQGAKVSWMVFGSRWFKSHSLMTQPKKYSKLAWKNNSMFLKICYQTHLSLAKLNCFFS